MAISTRAILPRRPASVSASELRPSPLGSIGRHGDRAGRAVGGQPRPEQPRVRSCARERRRLGDRGQAEPLAPRAERVRRRGARGGERFARQKNEIEAERLRGGGEAGLVALVGESRTSAARLRGLRQSTSAAADQRDDRLARDSPCGSRRRSRSDRPWLVEPSIARPASPPASRESARPVGMRDTRPA